MIQIINIYFFLKYIFYFKMKYDNITATNIFIVILQF